jgi:hypothetical protein
MARRLLRYLAALRETKRALRDFAESSGDFSALGSHAALLQDAHEAVLRRVSELRTDL